MSRTWQATAPDAVCAQRRQEQGFTALWRVLHERAAKAVAEPLVEPRR